MPTMWLMTAASHLCALRSYLVLRIFLRRPWISGLHHFAWLYFFNSSLAHVFFGSAPFPSTVTTWLSLIRSRVEYNTAAALPAADVGNISLTV